MPSAGSILNRKDFAAYVEAAKADILGEWEERCRQRVSAAKVQSRLALRDSIPKFIDQLVETLRSPEPDARSEKNAEVAREHAEDRAEQTEYTLDQVIAEYHILRAIAIEYLDSKVRTDTKTRKITHEFIDLGINKAAVRFMEIASAKQRAQTAEIEAAKIASEQASQAKSAFLANMSHEIRTPLGAIMGFVGLMKESGVEHDEVTANYLAIIDRNSHHLLRIIDDILDLTKVEAGKMIIEKVEFPLIQFLADFASLAGLRARENGIIFDFKSEKPLPEFIVGDPTRIRQILSNIVGNAIKFTEKGRVELTVVYDKNQLDFRVTDTGRGISTDQRAELFQAFSQADSSTTRKFGGTGLGLVLTKKLSQAMGGDFRLVESELGKGSVFEVNIPVALPDAVALVPTKSVRVSPVLRADLEPNQVDLKGLEILLVEDSPDNQYLVQKILERTGARITLANNGAEGLAKALTQEFGVVLMDIQMPVMDGHEAVRELRAKGYTAPVVALTAHAMKEEGERASKSGFSHFLTKPINRKNLIELLSRLFSPLNITM